MPRPATHFLIPILKLSLSSFWDRLTYIESHITALGVCLLKDMNLIFQMRCFTFLQVQRLQKYKKSKLEVEKKIATSARIDTNLPRAGPNSHFFISKSDLIYLCNFLTCKNLKYLIWKIWFKSFWREKAKVVAWLLMCIMLAEITPILYYVLLCSLL